MPKCKYCGEPISWKRNKAGKMIPIEEACVNIVGDNTANTYYLTEKGDVIRGRIVGDANEEGYIMAYQYHYISSPECNK